MKIVLGGGLGGLSAAYYLRKKLPVEAITLIESSNRTGGWIKSSLQENGVIFEQGPRTIRPKGEAASNTLQLIEELSLENKVVSVPSSHPAATNRMIYANGELHSLPSSFTDLFKTKKPFSKPLIRHLLKDVFTPKKLIPLGDESIYDFINRRFGNEIAEYLISPLICGICAGNAKEISVKFLLKQHFENEQKYGSVAKGIVNNVLNKKYDGSNRATSNLSQKAMMEKWSVFSFQNGIETLTKTIHEKLIQQDVDISLNTTCLNLELSNDGATVHLNDGKEIKCNHLISSLPAKDMGKLITKHPDLSKLLYNIKFVTVGVVNMQFDKILNIKPGFGFLVAPKENLPILGVTYDSCSFPKDDNTVLTVMMGGYWFNKHFGTDPDENELLNIALQQTKQILKFSEDPVKYKVSILKNCIPQYNIGHEKCIDAIKKYIEVHQLPISLCGSSYNGVGINDVILSAKAVVNNIS